MLTKMTRCCNSGRHRVCFYPFYDSNRRGCHYSRCSFHDLHISMQIVKELEFSSAAAISENSLLIAGDFVSTQLSRYLSQNA